jgi:hypothetical protein
MRYPEKLPGRLASPSKRIGSGFQAQAFGLSRNDKDLIPPRPPGTMGHGIEVVR